ncbi:TAXI family TRAP transporter solute-binding subunit [Pokkaliibacter plantistimulans]|nr:TAXI family TRAP transporter solute-binding subunit [Pokkaliibacter plantistimulans]
MNRSVQWLSRGLVSLTLGALSFGAHAEHISMETTSASSIIGIIPQSMAGYWAKAGVDVQLAMDQTLTKSLLKVSRGSLDSAVSPTLAYEQLKEAKGPYASMGEKAKASAATVRALFGMPGSVYHPMVWTDSGITSWQDAKGKRIFIGPPAGSANAQITALLQAAGLKEGDYEAIKAPWGAASQSFQDGQSDVYVAALPLGSQTLSELSLSRKVHFLSLDDAQAYVPAGLGMTRAVIPAHTYPGQDNDQSAITWQTQMMLVVRKDLSDEVAYQLTKGYFEHRQDLASTNALLGQLADMPPLDGVSAPLHPGAVRYYREAGISIPAELLPQ